MESAIAYLHKKRARFVICKGKRPIEKGWPNRRPSVESVCNYENAGLDLGLVPFSIGTTVLDVDHGNATELATAAPPLTSLKTPGGDHLVYQDNEPRGNVKFDYCGCQGDIRGAKGYVRLYEGGAEKLADALHNTEEGTAPFPVECLPKTSTNKAPHENIGTVLPFKTKFSDVPLEQVQEDRHIALFNVIRYWAYFENKGDNLKDWIYRVDSFAQSQNQRLPTPEKRQKVFTDLSKSIAEWTWAGKGAIDHTTVAQTRRGKKLGRIRREANQERDSAILNDSETGDSLRELSKKYGLSTHAIQNILKRECVKKLAGVPRA